MENSLPPTRIKRTMPDKRESRKNDIAAALWSALDRAEREKMQFGLVNLEVKFMAGGISDVILKYQDSILIK